MSEKGKRSFYKLGVSTVIAVYTLILVGGIVRSTGSGMGCPDWPKCFGSWVPPTSVSDLPENYKEIYAAHREKKNIRFARYLSAFGFSAVADKILADKSILQEADFNPTKTWIEYLNRVVGVIIGFLIFAVFIFSWRYRKTDPRLTITAFVTLILVGVQGWLGSFVVSTNLTAWTITVHMFLALVIVALLIYITYESSERAKIYSPYAGWWLCACMLALLVQILFGTHVREAIDGIAASFDRRVWIESLGAVFIQHRSFSWVVFILHVGLIVKLRKTPSSNYFPLLLILLILGTILSGMGMAFFSVPAFLQPVHLLLATLTFGMQFLFLLKLSHAKNQALV